MGWLLLLSLTLALALVSSVQLVRRAEIRRLAQRISELRDAKQKGSHQARLQFPHIDLSRCIGCGTCVQACPEQGVLDLIHGQAVVIHGARCVGHGMCAAACPVGAIELTLGDLSQRRDIPAITQQFEVRNMPGMFLAGELTGYALIRTAVTHGTIIVNEISRRLAATRRQAKSIDQGAVLDLCIIGAGPAGIAASLQAKSKGLSFVTLEQETLGGTISKYPRRKLAMTQPVTLPLYGKLTRTSYSKEELMELWSGLAERYQLPVLTGEEFIGVTKHDEQFEVKTKTTSYRSRFVCLALGRRGTPRKLHVPGEELPKVAYSLIDAQSYRDRKILVVGGGDSAIETALGLAEQPGNKVTLSYRKSGFSRLKARNEARFHQAIQRNLIECVFASQVREIRADAVELAIHSDTAGTESRSIPNDDVFIMAGGIPPFKLLESSGVSFDPADRETPPPELEGGQGLVQACIIAWALSVTALVWVLLFKRYYLAPVATRALIDLHQQLRPSGNFGLSCGVVAVLLIACNLVYLLRRKWLSGIIPGRLTAWMTTHVVTGILAFLLVLLHAGLAPKNTLGGHACLALGLLVVTGAVGRYFYAFVPRATNGQELALEDLHSQIAIESTEWDRLGRGFGDEAQEKIRALVAAGKWEGNFVKRFVALLNTQSAARQAYLDLLQRGKEAGLSQDQLSKLISLAQKAYQTALLSGHYEDLRALLNSWRYFHRWVALLMVLLTAIHIYVACSYGAFLR